jgi:hypothetical protein
VPFYLGVRRTQAWWAEHRPDHAAGTVFDEALGRAVTDLSSAGRTGGGEDALTEEVMTRKRSPRSEAAVRRAVADALGIDEDSPEMDDIHLTEGEYNRSGARIDTDYRPWLAGSEDDGDDAAAVTAKDLKAAMAEVQEARSAPGKAQDAPKPPKVAPEATPEPSQARGRVGQGQAERFGESKGFVSSPRRPSQTTAGRRARYLKDDVRKGHCPNVHVAAQNHKPRTEKEPSS